MKYIRNREQFRYSERLVEEAPANQIYDGTWEDTFVGRFFSFLGRKVVHKMKKSSLNKLLNQMQRELEKSQFKTIETEPLVQKYQVYQNIAIVKNYLKGSDNFSKEEVLDLINNAIEEHTEQKDNDNLPESIREAHTKVLKGFDDVLNFIESLDEESLTESLTQEGEDEGYMHAGEIVGEFMRKPFSGDLRLGKLKLIGNQKGYESNKSEIKNVLNQLASSLSEMESYIDNKEEKAKVTRLIDSIQGASYDDYVSFANDFDKNIKPLSREIINFHQNEIKELSKGDDEERRRELQNSKIEKFENDDSKVYLKWYSNSKKSEKVGYGDKELMTSLLNDDDSMNMERWEELMNISQGSDEEKHKIFSINTPGGTNLFQFDQTVKRGDFLQIGDVEIKHPSEGDLENEEENSEEKDIRPLIEDKMDEVFPNDDIYKREMTVSKEEMEDIHNSMKSKVENQKEVVDPIAILRIFNRAYNSFSITKDEFNNLTNKYSPRVAARKKDEYELVGDSARQKKLFREWNDGVLAMLQQYGEYLSKHTKKFIITMLDDNHLFGNRGAQAKLLSEYFDVPLDKAKSNLKDIESPAEHRSRITEDNTVKFSSVNNVEMNTDKIRRVPFIMEYFNQKDERKMMSVFPMNAKKSKDTSSLKMKYSIGNDYGFLKNYMQGINVELDTGKLEELGMVDTDDSPVYITSILSDNGFLEKGNSYKMTKIHRVSDDKGYDDQTIEISKIYMLLGSKDEGLYRLPSLNDDMKKSIKASKHDKLV